MTLLLIVILFALLSTYFLFIIYKVYVTKMYEKFVYTPHMKLYYKPFTYYNCYKKSEKHFQS